MLSDERLEQLIVNTNVDVRLKMKDLTCFNCVYWINCPFAFDPYNTNDDCIASK